MRTLHALSFAVRFIEVPANSLRVFTRKRIGYRELRCGTMVLLAIVLLLNWGILAVPLDMLFNMLLTMMPLLAFLPMPEPRPDLHLTYFGLALLVMVAFRNWQTLRYLKKGRLWHSFSPGQSYFEFLARVVPLSHVYRFYEPGAWFLAGLLTDGLLGDWLLYSALCLFAIEARRNKSELTTYFELLDRRIEDEQRARTQALLRGEPVTCGLRSIAQTSGLSTGILSEIAPPVALLPAPRPMPFPDAAPGAPRLAPDAPALEVLEAASALPAIAAQ